jgi:hypothetical protein
MRVFGTADKDSVGGRQGRLKFTDWIRLLAVEIRIEER